MNTAECARWRQLLGVHALGHLEERESAGLQAHLDGCRRCRAEAADLASIERAMRMVDPERIESLPQPDRELEGRILDQVRQERSRRRRWTRWALVGTAAAVVAVVVFIVTAPFERTPRGVEFTDAPAGVRASATLESRSWGTEIKLVVQGLPAGKVYSVWLEDTEGDRVASGSFRAIPERELTLVLGAGLPLDAAASIGINADGSTVMRAELIRQGPIERKR